MDFYFETKVKKKIPPIKYKWECSASRVDFSLLRSSACYQNYRDKSE